MCRTTTCTLCIIIMVAFDPTKEARGKISSKSSHDREDRIINLSLTFFFLTELFGHGYSDTLARSFLRRLRPPFFILCVRVYLFALTEYICIEIPDEWQINVLSFQISVRRKGAAEAIVTIIALSCRPFRESRRD